MVDCLASFFVISNKFGWHIASRCRFPGLPESVLLDFFDAEPLHVPLAQAEELDEVGAIHIADILSLDCEEFIAELPAAVLIDVIDRILGHEIGHHLVLDLHAVLADGGFLTESFLQVKRAIASQAMLG